MPRGMNLFDYKIPQDLMGKLKIGQVVNIPFKKSIIKGVIANFTDHSTFKYIKEIDSPDDQINQISESSLNFLKWFSQYHYFSYGSTLNLILPPTLKQARKSTLEAEKVDSALLTNQPINQSTKDSAEQLMCSTNKKYLLFPHDQKGKEQLFYSLCEHAIEEDKQIQIIFPQLSQVEQFVSKLSPIVQAKTAVITSDLNTSKNKYIDTWHNIRDKKVNVIIGTRSSVFFPFDNLDLSIADYAHSEDHKSWDQNPRFHTINCLRHIQNLTNCKLIISSVCPRLEDAYIAKKENYKLINIGQENKSIELVDLKHERQTGFTYLSNALMDKLKEVNKAGKKTLIIVNKKGLHSQLTCFDCGITAQCEKCNLPLVPTKDNKLTCSTCNQEKEQYLKCPKCNSTNIKSYGIGIDQIQDNISSLGFNNNLIRYSTGKNLDSQDVNIDYLGIVYADSLIHLADYNASSKLYSFLKELINQTTAKDIVIQTAFKDSIAFDNITKTYGAFYTSEMENRTAFNYPPRSKCVKLFFQHHDESICMKEAQNLYYKLKKTLKDDIMITEPYLYYKKMIRSRYRGQISIFFPAMDLKTENAYLREVPTHWHIDPNPIDLL